MKYKWKFFKNIGRKKITKFNKIKQVVVLNFVAHLFVEKNKIASTISIATSNRLKDQQT